MAIEESEEALVERLKALGLTLLTEWDTLFFLYRHPSSLCTVAQIAALVGHGRSEIGDAVNRLDEMGFIQRSRVSQGIRFYRFAMPEDAFRRSSLLELMDLAKNRAGRLLLFKNLKFASQEPPRKVSGSLRLA